MIPGWSWPNQPPWQAWTCLSKEIQAILWRKNPALSKTWRDFFLRVCPKFLTSTAMANWICFWQIKRVWGTMRTTLDFKKKLGRTEVGKCRMLEDVTFGRLLGVDVHWRDSALKENPFLRISGVRGCGHLSVADWDQDGRLDLLMADLAHPMIHFGQDSEGQFRLVDDSPLLRVTANRTLFRRPLMVDWNKDGRMDLILVEQPFRPWKCGHSGTIEMGMVLTLECTEYTRVWCVCGVLSGLVLSFVIVICHCLCHCHHCHCHRRCNCNCDGNYVLLFVVYCVGLRCVVWDCVALYIVVSCRVLSRSFVMVCNVV